MVVPNQDCVGVLKSWTHWMIPSSVCVCSDILSWGWAFPGPGDGSDRWSACSWVSAMMRYWYVACHSLCLWISCRSVSILRRSVKVFGIPVAICLLPPWPSIMAFGSILSLFCFVSSRPSGCYVFISGSDRKPSLSAQCETLSGNTSIATLHRGGVISFQL